MTKVVFPGTFDPIHYGHMDIALRASKLFDEVVVAVYDKPLKSLLFSAKERIELAREVLAGESRISVVGYSGLTVSLAREIGASALLRGLRAFRVFSLSFRLSPSPA